MCSWPGQTVLPAAPCAHQCVCPRLGHLASSTTTNASTACKVTLLGLERTASDVLWLALIIVGKASSIPFAVLKRRVAAFRSRPFGYKTVMACL